MSVSLNALFNPSYEMLLKLLEINLEREALTLEGVVLKLIEL